MVKFENIIFWLLILGIIAVALWLLVGSPTETSAIITIASFVAASEILLWKALFNIDKKTVISFVKLRNEMGNRFNSIEGKLNNIEDKLKWQS